MIGEHVYYFGGVDPAPSEGHKSDDGALVVGRASPRQAEGNERGWTPSENPADWWFDYVFADRLTWRQQASARQWAGYIHVLHQRFNFTRLTLDPNHGGYYIKRELDAPRAPLNGIETEVTPIVEIGSVGVVRGHFILSLFKRGDPCIESLWEGLDGDDKLNDAAYSEMKLAIQAQQVAWPGRYEDLLDQPARLAALTAEQRGIWQQLTGQTGMVGQYANVVVETNADGTWSLTRRGARQFSAVGKKDLMSAGMMSYIGFRSWLRQGDWVKRDAADAGGISGW